MSWTFRHPTSADLSLMVRLLKQCDLPAEDAGEHLRNFYLAWDNDRLVGMVGMEIQGPKGLLRSLAVESKVRGKGLGRALSEKIMAFAESRHVTEVGLLTTTAESFFSKQGFLTVTRDKIPDWVKGTKEYRLFCPSTAVFMVKNLSQA